MLSSSWYNYDWECSSKSLSISKSVKHLGVIQSQVPLIHLFERVHQLVYLPILKALILYQIIPHKLCKYSSAFSEFKELRLWLQQLLKGLSVLRQEKQMTLILISCYP